MFLPNIFRFITHNILKKSTVFALLSNVWFVIPKKRHTNLYHFRMKSFEMAFESYPQLIMGLFIWQGLQIKETLNIVSISVSAASAIYGFGDILVGFIYIIDSSNSSSFTFWSSQFTTSSRSNWTVIWTGNSNGTWTDKQTSHFSTAKEISVKATFFFM